MTIRIAGSEKFTKEELSQELLSWNGPIANAIELPEQQSEDQAMKRMNVAWVPGMFEWLPCVEIPQIITYCYQEQVQSKAVER